MEKIGVVAIIVTDRHVVPSVQAILSDNADIIRGRMGIPDRDKDIYAISVVVSGSNERISAMTGKLGRLNAISVKSAIVSVEA